MNATRGSSIVEALVALALAGIAMAGLAGAATMSVHHLRLARSRDSAVALAASRLETLRAGPLDDGSEAIGPFVRRWWADDGRGDASPVDVEVAFDDRAVLLSSEVSP
jgi:Tfp pilus assembly protein PilV